jgi:hypothetical protein
MNNLNFTINLDDLNNPYIDYTNYIDDFRLVLDYEELKILIIIWK